MRFAKQGLCKCLDGGGYVVIHSHIKKNVTIRERCHVASTPSLLGYRCLWLGTVCRIAPDRLSQKVMFADIERRGQKGSAPSIWKALIQKDIEVFLKEQDLHGTLIRWWDLGRIYNERMV